MLRLCREDPTLAHDDAMKYDVVIIGAGIMGATLAAFLEELEPSWTIAVVERQAQPAMESSSSWHNAGTGHSALCELNYTPQLPDGTVQTDKAVLVHGQWQESLQAWAYFVRAGKLSPDFIHAVPHMSFVGEADVDFLRARYEALRAHPYFANLEYTEDPAVIREWAPLLMEGRTSSRVAATRSLDGTDVDFGQVTRELLSSTSAHLYYSTEVQGLKRRGKSWLIETTAATLTADFVFVGAGGGTLPILQKAKMREIRGYAGFPVAGKFWHSEDAEVVQTHGVKVYGKASAGAPPMSVPHLDSRIIDGKHSVLFGPFAGFSPRFLREGSLWDLAKSVRVHNLLPLLYVAFTNMGLIRYLVTELLTSKRAKLSQVKRFYPRAHREQWREIVAGQRVQIIRPEGRGRASLQFGTEVVVSEDGTIAGLLGASPGASTAVTIVLETLARAFPERKEEWAGRLFAIVPGADSEGATIHARSSLGLPNG